MLETFVPLLAAHLLGDFVFQTKYMVQHKGCLAVLLCHVLAVAVATALLLGQWHWPILAIIYGTHFALDAFKVYVLKRDTLLPFVLDQAGHVAVLGGLTLYYPTAFADGWWPQALGIEHTRDYLAVLTLLSGIILTVPAGGFLIGKATERFVQEVEDKTHKGLENGGMYIGWLERSLVLLLLLLEQTTAIGFLIAAKSILRFGDIQDTGKRKVIEYIIIGTLMSFGWALLVGAGTQKALSHWWPQKDAPVRVLIEAPDTYQK